MPRQKPKICAVIVNTDLKAIDEIAPLADLYEVRIDLIGRGWQEVAKQLQKPWLATNRRAEEGGRWPGSEESRIAELIKSLDMGARIVDVELATEHLKDIVPLIKNKARCLVSCHNLKETPPLAKMRDIARAQLEAGADICKVVTMANSFADNAAVLQLIREFAPNKVIAFAMGAPGGLSRVLCPLVGGEFIYASIEAGLESASGQITVRELRQLYGVLDHGK